MRHYEVVFLVNPGQSDQMSALVERYEGIITAEGGKVHRSEDWGRRQLAYPIQNFHKAHYWMFNVECDKSSLKELTEAFRFNDHVMRNLVIGRDEAVTEISLLAQEKSKEDERKAKAAVALAAEEEARAASEAARAAAEAAKPAVVPVVEVAKPAEAPVASDSEEQPAESAAADSEE